MRQTTERPEPVRSCIGCRTKRSQSALMRITKAAGDIEIDGPSRGRGAWICADKTTERQVAVECLETAIAKQAFARAWRIDIGADDITNIRRHTGHL
ncbi:MAG: YlxR family protein [Ilumatobacter sp.]|uniref:YlxR family protein n=1 Tax=Ilumatobacter sp. TaxID=1967498 RepID=UPI003751CCB1|nr:YlxR family protein [Ilumatobacter sp.]MDG2438072.1 YlxR family protein [Ilumatobacter sp.]